MAIGDCRDDAALQGAWKDFCRRLEAAGDKVFKDYNPATPESRADGFRFLTQNLGQAFDLAYETKDPRYPVIHPFNTPFCKLGGDSAEFTYQQAWIDGATAYKISGNRGTAPFLNFTVYGPHLEEQPGTGWPSLHDPFGDVPEANLFGHQIETNWDGGFELYVGGPERPTNWLPTTPNSRKLFIRQGFDRWSELPVTMRMERLDMDAPRPMAQPAEMIEAIGWAGRFMSGLMNDWPDHPYNYTPARFLDWINQFPPEPADNALADKRRGRSVANMAWMLAPDEALILEFDDHDGLWSVTNMGPFFASMDYLYRQVSFTPSRAKADSDGRIRLVMAHDDPGYHNWLDTQGFARGCATYRNLASEHRTELRTRVVKRAELASALPPDTATVTHDQRVRQLRDRFDGVRRRYLL
jgi:hypothetical protein